MLTSHDLIFSGSGDPRDLHSFPTRRSSDLLDFVAAHEQRLVAAHDIHDQPLIGVRRATVEDRKSTRLNSSHLGISYAVFCLKKKTPRSTHGSAHRRRERIARARTSSRPSR